jgi:hypothetical protein
MYHDLSQGPPPINSDAHHPHALPLYEGTNAYPTFIPTLTGINIYLLILSHNPENTHLLPHSHTH